MKIYFGPPLPEIMNMNEENQVLGFMHVTMHNNHFCKLKSNGLESRRTLNPKNSAFLQSHPCTIVRLKLRPSSHLSSNHSAALQSRLRSIAASCCDWLKDDQ